jgi:hypothetical protein
MGTPEVYFEVREQVDDELYPQNLHWYPGRLNSFCSRRRRRTCEDFTPVPLGKTKETNVLAASASTFSRSWQAPPPLMQFKSASTLHASTLTLHTKVTFHLLVRAVDSDVEFGVLCDITKAQAGKCDELLRLKPGREKYAIFVMFLSLLQDALYNVWHCGACMC